MSHAGVLLEIVRREAEKQERLAAIRIAKFPALEAAMRRAHETELESASLIEESETLKLAVKS